jgi:mannose-6-phosphate isomerase-like protein (cupin superfamily)
MKDSFSSLAALMGEREAPAEETIRIGHIQVRYLVDGSGAGETGLYELRLPARSNVLPSYSNTRSGEILYVLEGRLCHSVEGLVRVLGPGDVAVVARGAVHGLSNPYEESVYALVVVTPDTGPQCFRDLAALVDSTGRADKGKVAEAMARHGLVPAPPRAA